MTAEWHIQATSASFGYVERFLYKLDDYIRAYNISDKDATAVNLGVCLSIAREETTKTEIYPKTIRNWTASEAAVAEMVSGLTSEEKLRLAYEIPTSSPMLYSNLGVQSRDFLDWIDVEPLRV